MMDKDQTSTLLRLEEVATQGTWRFVADRLVDERGRVVAFLCEPGHEPTFQQVVDGEFIAEIRNLTIQLFPVISGQEQTISGQRETIERLRSRILRLEGELYGS